MLPYKLSKVISKIGAPIAGWLRTFSSDPEEGQLDAIRLEDRILYSVNPLFVGGTLDGQGTDALVEIDSELDQLLISIGDSEQPFADQLDDRRKGIGVAGNGSDGRNQSASTSEWIADASHVQAIASNIGSDDMGGFGSYPASDEVSFSEPNSLASGKNLMNDLKFADVESPPPFPGYRVFTEGESIGGWSVEHGSVDFNGEHFVPSRSGGRTIELNQGDLPGSMVQTIATEPGRHYQITFEVTGDWLKGSAVNAVEVSAASEHAVLAVTRNEHWTPLEKSWDFRTLTFVAEESSVELRFSTVAEGNIPPPIMANIQVTALSDQTVEILEKDQGLKFDGIRGRFCRINPLDWTLPSDRDVPSSNDNIDSSVLHNLFRWNVANALSSANPEPTSDISIIRD